MLNEITRIYNDLVVFTFLDENKFVINIIVESFISIILQIYHHRKFTCYIFHKYFIKFSFVKNYSCNIVLFIVQ